MKKPKAPCKECVKRSESCRGNCKEWKKYEKEKTIYNNIVLEEKKKAVGIKVGKGKKSWIR